MFRQPREVHGGPEGVRSTERSEARNAPTRSEAEGHALRKSMNARHKPTTCPC